MKLQIGDKLYSKDENNNLILIRVLDIKGDIISVRYKDKVADFDIKYIKNNFTKLTPDGYVNFTIVKLPYDVKDVIITVHRTKDIENGINEPFAVCRQNINNFYAEQMSGQVGVYVGVSTSKYSIPSDIDFKQLLACNGVYYYESISVYIDDSLNSMLSLIKDKQLFDDILKYIKKSAENEHYIGFTSSLEELLDSTEFMFDFYKAFDIHRLTIKINMNEDNMLELHDKTCIETDLNCTITDECIIPYTKDIILENIKRPYILISDVDDILYLLVYTPKKRDVSNKYNSLFNR